MGNGQTLSRISSFCGEWCKRSINLHLIHGAAEMLNDLHIFDPLKLSWFSLSAAAVGKPPVGRASLGFAAVGLLLYVHAGFPESGSTMVYEKFLPLAVSG